MQRAGLVLAASLLLSSSFSSLCRAQQPSAPATAPEPASPLPVLRVYANRVQIPVLVLSTDRESLPQPIAANRFSVSFDNGPWFHASNARLQGDDPLDLAILLDSRGPGSDVLPKMDEVIAALAPTYLHPQDHVSIYSMDCSVLHAVRNVPADPERLKAAVDTALHSWTDRHLKRTSCRQDEHLWDVLAYVSQSLSKESGRRAILALTTGEDDGSARRSDELTARVQANGVTIVGLNPLPEPPRTGFRTNTPDPFPGMCELTGGVMLRLGGSSLAHSLQHILTMLRGRYIVEFPRPSNATAGSHNLQVKIDKGTYFIRSAGNEVPLPDIALKDDPNVIVPDAANAPLIGKQPKSAPPPAQPSAPTTQPPSTPPAMATPPPARSTEPNATLTTQTLKVTTRLTVVDVTVMDSANHPVHGLTQADFAVKEDGKPQPLRHFSEYGTQIPLANQPAPPPLPPNTYSNQQPPVPTTSALNIILLDEVTTGMARGLGLAPNNLTYARQQSINYLKSLPAGTQVALLELGSSLRIVQGFTADRDILLAAINSVSYKPVSRAYSTGGGDACTVANMQSRLAVAALQQAAAYLSGIQGRKNLIWFTPGTPWLTNYPAFSRINCLQDFTDELHRAYSSLTAAEVSLYPIDPRGLFADPSTSAARATTARSARGAALGGAPAAIGAAQAFAGANANDHDALKDMAEATGGVAYYNRNDLDGALREAIATGSDYYSLAYVPPISKYDGKYHTIDVKVSRPGLHLQYRPGYTSFDPASLPRPIPKTEDASTTASTELPAIANFHAAMGHGVPDSTQLLFHAGITPAANPAAPSDPVAGMLNPTLKGSPLVRYDIHYEFPADQVTFTINPDGTQKASVEFDLAAYDGTGKMLNVLRQTANVTLTAAQVPVFVKAPFRFVQQLDLPPGKLFLRAGILDTNSTNTGTLEIPLTVPKP